MLLNVAPQDQDPGQVIWAGLTRALIDSIICKHTFGGLLILAWRPLRAQKVGPQTSDVLRLISEDPL